MGIEVQVPVSVRGFPVDSEVQAAILFSLEKSVKEQKVPPLSSSTVNLMVGYTLWRWSRSSSTVPFFTMQHVLSTYRFHSLGLVGTDSSASFSKNSIHRLASLVETGEPIAVPSLCS